ncbi:uncharacterized protein [Palaemon carinicauda]|uniref:uncharacterized protein n=1 Tax=Palaemon carinicauda TaxID=392227 RepID=UPI0035B5BCC7
MASKIFVICFLGIWVTTLAQEKNPGSSLEEVCPGLPTYKCAVKIEYCLKEQIPSAELMEYMEMYGQNRDIICSEGQENENFDKITACALQNIGIIVDSKVNRPLVKRVLASSLTNSSQGLQTAMAEAVDTCPEILHPESIENYYNCLLRICVEVMDKENKNETGEGITA